MLDSRIKACLNEDGRLDETQLQRPYWPLPGHQINGAFAMLDWFDPGLDEEDFIGMGTTLTDYAMARLKATGAALEAYRECKWWQLPFEPDTTWNESRRIHRSALANSQFRIQSRSVC